VRGVPDMIPQAVANTVSLCVRDPLHPANLVCGLEAQDFSDEGVCMRFYMHLMHHSGQSLGDSGVSHAVGSGGARRVDAQRARRHHRAQRSTQIGASSLRARGPPLS
jgi:hypothetical protein